MPGPGSFLSLALVLIVILIPVPAAIYAIRKRGEFPDFVALIGWVVGFAPVPLFLNRGIYDWIHGKLPLTHLLLSGLVIGLVFLFLPLLIHRAARRKSKIMAWRWLPVAAVFVWAALLALHFQDRGRWILQMEACKQGGQTGEKCSVRDCVERCKDSWLPNADCEGSCSG